jgi:hypothetical protein
MTTEQHSNHYGKDYLVRERSHCAKSLDQLIQKYPNDPNLQKRYLRLDCKKLIKSGQVSEAQMDDVLHSYFLNDEVAVIQKSLLIISKCEKELNKETVKYLRELSANEFSTVYSQIENNNTIISLDDNGPLSKRNKNDSLDNESWEYLDLMSFGGVELQLDNNSSPWITFTHLWEFNNENELKDFSHNMMIAFQHLSIPLLFTKPPLKELPLHQIFSKCKYASLLQLESLFSEHKALNVPNVSTSQIQDVNNFYSTNQLNDDILNSLHQVLMNKINIPIHIFFWNRTTLKPMIKVNGILYDHTTDHFLSVDWSAKDAIFLMNSGDSDFDKFTLYEYTNIY